MNSILAQYQRISDSLNGRRPVADDLVTRLDVPSSLTATDAVTVELPALAPEGRAAIAWYEELHALFEEGRSRDLISNVVVHGSFGDLTFNDYSDLDLVLVLPQGTLGTVEQAEALRTWVHRRFYPFLLTVDPLQHHGPFYLWDRLSEHYSEAILPLDVYRRAWAVEPTRLVLRVVEPPGEQSEFLSISRTGKLLGSSKGIFKRGHTMYAMKRYLSNVMLVPAIVAADLGAPMHKADSFDWFYARFEDEAAKALREASTIRREWPPTPDWYRTLVLMARRTRLISTTLVRKLYRSSSIRRRIEDDIQPLIPALEQAIHRELSTRVRSSA